MPRWKLNSKGVPQRELESAPVGTDLVSFTDALRMFDLVSSSLERAIRDGEVRVFRTGERPARGRPAVYAYVEDVKALSARTKRRGPKRRKSKRDQPVVGIVTVLRNGRLKPLKKVVV